MECDVCGAKNHKEIWSDTGEVEHSIFDALYCISINLAVIADKYKGEQDGI